MWYVFFYRIKNSYLYCAFGLIIILSSDNVEKKVSTSSNDTADGTLNVDSKSNILKKLSKF